MPKTAIASLFSQLKYFRPSDTKPWDGKFLVNQNEGPDRDKLLHKIGEASMEIMDFIKGRDELQKKAETYYNGLATIDKTIGSVVASQPDTDLLIKFDNLMARYRVMCDFINILANNTPNEKLRPAVERFMRYKGKQILDEYAQKTTTIPIPPKRITCLFCAGTGNNLTAENDPIENSECKQCNGVGWTIQHEQPSGQNGLGSPLPQAGDGF